MRSIPLYSSNPSDVYAEMRIIECDDCGELLIDCRCDQYDFWLDEEDRHELT